MNWISVKFHTIFKRYFRLTYSTGCTVRDTELNRTVLSSDQTTDCTTRGYFPIRGNRFSLLHMICPGPTSPPIYWTLQALFLGGPGCSWRRKSPHITVQRTTRAHKSVINNLTLNLSLLFYFKSQVLASANVFLIAALAIRHCVPTDGAAHPGKCSDWQNKSTWRNYSKIVPTKRTVVLRSVQMGNRNSGGDWVTHWLYWQPLLLGCVLCEVRALGDETALHDQHRERLWDMVCLLWRPSCDCHMDTSNYTAGSSAILRSVFRYTDATFPEENSASILMVGVLQWGEHQPSEFNNIHVKI